jgi:hypothetical protein
VDSRQTVHGQQVVDRQRKYCGWRGCPCADGGWKVEGMQTIDRQKSWVAQVLWTWKAEVLQTAAVMQMVARQFVSYLHAT